MCVTTRLSFVTKSRRPPTVENVTSDDDPANPLAAAPLWGFGAELVPLLEGLSGPPFELADAVEHAVGRGLEIAGVELGKSRQAAHQCAGA